MSNIDHGIHLGKSWINAYNALLGDDWTILCNRFHGSVRLARALVFLNKLLLLGVNLVHSAKENCKLKIYNL